jgi:hypothetical protein
MGVRDTKLPIGNYPGPSDLTALVQDPPASPRTTNSFPFTFSGVRPVLIVFSSRSTYDPGRNRPGRDRYGWVHGRDLWGKGCNYINTWKFSPVHCLKNFKQPFSKIFTGSHQNEFPLIPFSYPQNSIPSLHNLPNPGLFQPLFSENFQTKPKLTIVWDPTTPCLVTFHRDFSYEEELASRSYKIHSFFDVKR